MTSQTPEERPNIEEWKDSHKGKLWSIAVQKCFEAPFPEVAIQHLLMRIDEKHHQQLQKAREEALREIIEVRNDRNKSTRELLDTIDRYQAELDQDISPTDT